MAAGATGSFAVVVVAVSVVVAAEGAVVVDGAGAGSVVSGAVFVVVPAGSGD